MNPGLSLFPRSQLNKLDGIANANTANVTQIATTAKNDWLFFR
uniref:Uncharacterized protein n=1 Tax=Klebsiella pneumoniae TaxID=573 RepID=A0A193PMT4_KLEPN|nr:hypothetical protein [Klebsiella pneumoniae]